jgi:2-polyprenyl-6-methoxyphenol hydroxylase-like FAD-dependent oxidoreductase
MEQEKTYDVVIVGMGPVGLMLAAMLGQDEHEVAIVERHAGLYGLPRAGHIDHEIMRLLQSIDCHEPVLEDCYPTLEYIWKNAGGETLLEFDWGAEGVSGWHSDYMQYQPVMEQAMADRLDADPAVTTLRNWEAVELVEHADHVELVIEATELRPGEQVPSGTGERQSLRGRYLVAADGARSFVRSTLGIEREDLGFNERWLDVDARKKRPIELDFDCGQICDPRRPITVLPLGKRHRRWEWSLLPGETQEEFERPETAWKLLDELGFGPDDVEIVRQIVYTFEARIAERWQQGRIFLVGDAAHTMPPFMGQGMCSGMRDAKNLSWRFDLVLRGLAPAELLDSFECERKPHLRDWTVISLEAGKVPCTLDPEAARERDERFRAGWRPPLPDMPKLNDGVLHRQADGSIDAATGDLGLQARVRREKREGLFDDVVGIGWTLISIAPDPRAALDDRGREVLKALGFRVAAMTPPGQPPAGPDEVEDVDGAYQAHLAERGWQAMVVRPDFYVFGGVPSLAELPALLGDLAGQLGLALPAGDRPPGSEVRIA